MARKNRGHRSLGEMISTVCFYGVGLAFIFEGLQRQADGVASWEHILLFVAGGANLMGGARFIIADLIYHMRGDG